MKKDPDPDYVVRVEQAIKDKYGAEAIINPKSTWNKEKEEEYLKQVKDFYSENKREKSKIQLDDFYLSDALTNKVERTCPVCAKFSISSKDDVYMNKFACCFDCYIKYVEHREDRWSSGWRPKT